jgi:NAD(P)-dependent dehydrogenase (short-subunit alcohol dehydrogenase family)
MPGRLDDKVVVITGGVSGMGLGAVETFVAEGAKVVVADIQAEKGTALESRFNGSVRFAKCDVRDEAEIVGAVELAVSEFGGLDVMYHNAGVVGDLGTVESITVEGWDDTFAIILRSGMLALKHAAPAMKARGGGSVILTSSAAGVALGGAGKYAYSVAKNAVIMMGRFAALELAPHKIRVNTIVPGAIPTSIWSGHVSGDAAAGDRMNHDLDKFAQMQALPQAGSVEDIAETALFLASDKSKFVTGATITVDGGLTLFRTGAGTAASQLEAVDDAIQG